MNGTRHVIIAMSLTALVFIIAGDSWNKPGSVLNAKTYTPVKPADKKS